MGVVQRNQSKAVEYLEWKKSAKKKKKEKKCPTQNKDIIICRNPAHNLNNTFQVLI